MKFLLSTVVVASTVISGALLAGFVRGAMVEGDPEGYLLVMAIAAGALGAVCLSMAIARDGQRTANHDTAHAHGKAGD